MTSHYHYIQTYPTLSPVIPSAPRFPCWRASCWRDAGIGKTFDATAIQESLTRLFESSHGFFTSGLTNLTDVFHIFCNHFHIFSFLPSFSFLYFSHQKQEQLDHFEKQLRAALAQKRTGEGQAERRNEMKTQRCEKNIK